MTWCIEVAQYAAMLAVLVPQALSLPAEDEYVGKRQGKAIREGENVNTCLNRCVEGPTDEKILKS